MVAQREEEKSGERIWDEDAGLISIPPARASKVGNMRQAPAVLTNCSNGGASLPSNCISGKRETACESMRRSLKAIIVKSRKRWSLQCSLATVHCIAHGWGQPDPMTAPGSPAASSLLPCRGP
jgi:hypothetical protein